MIKNLAFLIGMFVIVVASPRLSSGVVVIDSMTTIDENNRVRDEMTVVRDGQSPPTIVTIVSGGSFGDDDGSLPLAVELLGSSELHMRGGFVGTRRVDGVGIMARDSAKVIIELGNVDALSTAIRAESRSQILIQGGFVAGERGASVLLTDQSSLQIVGGRSHGSIITQDNSLAELRGGAFGGSGELVRAADSSTVNIYGGDFAVSETDISFSALNDATINIFGLDLQLNNNRLTGRLSDGSLLDEGISIQQNGRIVLHEIPEPGSLILAGSSTAVLIARSRRNGRSRRSPTHRPVDHSPVAPLPPVGGG